MNVEEEAGFRYFYDKMGFGPAEFKETPPAALIERYRGKVPDRMLDYWQAYGFCSFGKGLFWTVNPDEYAPVSSVWLNGLTLPFQDSFYVLGRSALGNLYVWGTHTGQSLTIYPMQGTIFPSDRVHRWQRAKAIFSRTASFLTASLTTSTARMHRASRSLREPLRYLASSAPARCMASSLP